MSFEACTMHRKPLQRRSIDKKQEIDLCTLLKP